jgi:hypothetical protein
MPSSNVFFSSEHIGASRENTLKRQKPGMKHAKKPNDKTNRQLLPLRKESYMAVSSVSNESGMQSLVDLLHEARTDASVLDSSGTLASSNKLLSFIQNQKAHSAYGGGSVSSAIGQAALQRALSEMSSSDGKITFSQVAEHREQLELEFTVSLRAALLKKGVSLETEFSLSMDANGKIDVLCDDPVAKEIIQKHLADNPKACEQFGYIQALSNLERARQSPASAMTVWRDARSATVEFQTQALEAFFGAAMNSGMDYSSILANFGTGENSKASFYTGLNFTV